MVFVRKALLILLTPIFVFLLFILAVDVSVWRIVGNSKNIEKVVADSGVYNDVMPSVLKAAEQQPEGTGLHTLYATVGADVVNKAAEQAFPASYIEQNVNQIIDNIYLWLNGKISQPNFQVNLNQAKQTFANNIGAAAKAKAESLPSCGHPLESAFYTFSATCLPTGLTPDYVASTESMAAMGTQGFLDYSVITPDRIKGSDSQHSIFADQLKKAPSVFHKLKTAPLIGALLVILLAATIVLLSPHWRRGLKHLAWILVVVGIFMLIFAYGFDKGVTGHAIPSIKLNNSTTQKEVQKVATDLAQSIDKNYYEFGGLYLILGALGLGGLWFENYKKRPSNSVKPVPAAKIRSY